MGLFIHPVSRPLFSLSLGGVFDDSCLPAVARAIIHLLVTHYGCWGWMERRETEIRVVWPPHRQRRRLRNKETEREVSREPEQKKVDNQIGRVRSGTPKRISHTSSKQTVNKWLSCVRRRERAESTSYRIGEQTGFQDKKLRIFMIKKWIFASQKERYSYLRQEGQKFAVWWERTVRGWSRSPKNWKLDYGEYF